VIMHAGGRNTAYLPERKTFLSKIAERFSPGRERYVQHAPMQAPLERGRVHAPIAI